MEYNATNMEFFILGLIFTLTLIGFAVAIVTPGINRFDRRFFSGLFGSVTIGVLITLVDAYTYQYPSFAATQRIAAYFEYLFVFAPVPMFTVFLLRCIGEYRKNNRFLLISLALWAIFCIMMTVNQFMPFFYYISDDNKFFRTEWHPLLLLPLIIIMILNLARTFESRNKLTGKYYMAFMIYLIPYTLATVTHALIYSAVALVWGLICSSISMFCIILSSQFEEYLKSQREIYHQRANIMVLQMRPHFIYNAMMSVYYLCEKDPKKAQEVTLDFTAYLRKNFTAIASETPVPFTDELEHTKAYLAIEQVQFEDALLVDYDTPHTDFCAPPLTLQPIVENAVKHGADPENAPLCIVIRTRKTDFGSEIIVEDNGAGFSPADDNEPHIALSNIRERLRMYGGTLTIESREGGGAVVKATIPR